MTKVQLILGGTRSGKSSFALSLAPSRGRPLLIATAVAGDSEMAQRIARHRAARPSRWEIVEEPLRLCDALEKSLDAGRFVVVDSLTLWLSNLMAEGITDDMFRSEFGRLAARRRTGSVVFVSDEVGMGIVPANVLARRFLDLAGEMHQRISTVADRVYFVIAGRAILLSKTRREK